MNSQNFDLRINKTEPQKTQKFLIFKSKNKKNFQQCSLYKCEFEGCGKKFNKMRNLSIHHRIHVNNLLISKLNHFNLFRKGSDHTNVACVLDHTWIKVF